MVVRDIERREFLAQEKAARLIGEQRSKIKAGKITEETIIKETAREFGVTPTGVSRRKMIEEAPPRAFRRGTSNVVPSGRFTKEGKPIFERAKTETDVRRAVSEQRVQKFTAGGVKVSDTQRVQVTIRGKEKFVTPERALALGTKTQQEEAITKIERREKLEQTVRAKFQREETEARTATERRLAEPEPIKPIVTLRKEPTPEEVAKKPFLFPTILATKEAIKVEKRKKAIIERPALFPALFGLPRKELAMVPVATKVTPEGIPTGEVLLAPREVLKFTPTGLLTLPMVRTLTEEEQFRKKVRESPFVQEFRTGLIEAGGQFAVAGATFIAKPVVEAAIVPLPPRVKEKVIEFAPTEKQVRAIGEVVTSAPAQLITEGVEEIAYGLGTKRGLIQTGVVIGTFGLGAGVVGIVAKGTRFAKPVAIGLKAAPKIFVGALGIGRGISAGFRISAGESPITAISGEIGRFGGQLVRYGAVAKVFQLGVTGAKRIIPRKFTPVKLAGARERIIVGRKGQIERAFEIETALGKPFKARKAPRIKPVRLGFKESAIKIVKTKGGITQVIGGERFGVAEIKFPKGVVPKKGVLPTVTIKKVTGLVIRDPTIFIGKEPVLGKAVFPKVPARREFIGVKGFKRLEIRDIDLIILGKGKPQRFPFITPKEVQVGPSIRRGALVRQTIFRAQKVKGLEPAGFRETIFTLLQPKPRLEKPPKITIKPTKPKVTIDKIVELTGKGKREFVKIGVTKKKLDIGELKFKDVTKSQFVEVGQQLPSARRIALERITGSTQQALKSISVSTKKIVKPRKPTISVLETPSRARLALGQIAKGLVFVPPPQQVFKGQRLPTAGILVGREEVFDIGVTPISKIKPIKKVERISRQIQIIEPIVVPDITQIKRPTIDVIEEQAQAQDIVQDIVQITVPGPKPRPRPGPPPPPPFVPGGGLFFPGLLFFGGERIFRTRKRTEKAFGFTGDFIASVRNEFGTIPKQRIFTGQERRFKIKGARFVTPLPKKGTEGIFGLIRKQLEA